MHKEFQWEACWKVPTLRIELEIGGKYLKNITEVSYGDEDGTELTKLSNQWWSFVFVVFNLPVRTPASQYLRLFAGWLTHHITLHSCLVRVLERKNDYKNPSLPTIYV